MRVLINTLSVGHLSGQHVVYGFLRQLVDWTASQHELVIAGYESSRPPEEISGSHVRYLPVNDRLRNWTARSAWECLALPRIVRQQAVDLAFTVSGTITPGLKVPQVSLAQNPWCFIPQARRGMKQELKAKLQIRAYRKSLRDAEMMFFISDHLRNLYRTHAGSPRETKTDIALVGLDEATHRDAARLRAATEKDPLLIVSVSAMAPWKGVETLLMAVAGLRTADIPAKLRLVGPWPVPSYRRQIEEMTRSLNLTDAVDITGKVSKEELHRHYAEAKLFCLMSCCESFGIPAAEAMAFGTPVVSARDCAISEICAGAGMFGPAANAKWTADALAELLTDEHKWQQHSQSALLNAAGLRWEHCARPLMQIFSLN